jgi:XTP/dITP diphosphohydrolase
VSATHQPVLDVIAVMDRLRSPGGCPWDAEQTHHSLVPYLVEETYEVLDAIEAGDDLALREELGDLLLQVLFHARLAEERPGQPWSIDDVAADLAGKLRRRHPHVFADVAVTGAAEVSRNWDEIKRAEKRRTSVTDGVPLAQPALALAAKLVSRARRANLDPGAEASEADAADAATAGATAIGDELFAVVGRAVRAGIDPEQALRATALRYRAQLREREAADEAAAKES